MKDRKTTVYNISFLPLYTEIHQRVSVLQSAIRRDKNEGGKKQEKKFLYVAENYHHKKKRKKHLLTRSLYSPLMSNCTLRAEGGDLHAFIALTTFNETH